MTRKIRLNADDLEVLSFATAAQPEVRGTVRAAGDSDHPCYITIGYDRWTNCLAYVESYWGEETCTCPLVPDTDPSVCPAIDTAPPHC